MSPAYMLYERQLCDALPTAYDKWKSTTMSYSDKCGPISKIWKEIQIGRELATSRKLRNVLDVYDTNKQPLAVLSVGDCVAIQNQSGPNPIQWDRTGKVVERLANRQYLIRTDGSGRVLLQNRAHLKMIDESTFLIGVHMI